MAFDLRRHGHSVMVAAQESAAPHQRLAAPHGLTEAKPVTDNLAYLRMALLAAAWVRKRVPAASRTRFDALIRMAEHIEGGGAFERPQRDLLNRETPNVRQPNRAYSRDLTADEPTLRIAQAVGVEAEQTGIRNVGGKGARAACLLTVRLLTPPSQATAFLEALDALIAREDARTQLKKTSVQPSAPVAAGLWRGASAGRSTHWLMRLTSGRYALVWKVKGRWRLVEGARDDVLAAVDDAHFEAATTAVLSRADASQSAQGR